MTYLKINGEEIPAQFFGRMKDGDWDDRESKTIIAELDYARARELFHDGVSWAIIEEHEESVSDGGDTHTETKRTEFDNSEFNVLGDITVHTDGTCSVKMGKPTDLEVALEILYGGDE